MNKTDLIAMFKINDTQETLTKAMEEFKIQPLPLVSIIKNDCNVHFFHGSFENGTYKGKRTRTSLLESVYCMAYGMAYVYSKAVLNGLDWFGKKLVHLIDHSDFFAGVVWTYAVLTAWELLTR